MRSPQPSQIVDGHTSLEDTLSTTLSTAAMQTLSQSEPSERAQLTSPAPVGEPSLTPPPSSQVPAPAKNGNGTNKPNVTSYLASPPATTQAPDTHVAMSAPIEPPTDAQINTASIEELRRMVGDLTVSLNEARTSSAHYKLQYNLLQMESRESQNRMAVELDMAHREVDVLQAAEQRRKQEYMSPTQTAADVNNAHALLNEITLHSSKLEAENNSLRELVDQLDRQLLYKAGQLQDKDAEIKRLRDRIRQNREHMTGFLDNLHENNTSPSIFSTPRRTPHAHSTPRHPAALPRMHQSSTLENPGLEAILLADKVLSQETATQPTTPSRNPIKRGHHRGTQSLSSLPSTPTRPTSVRATAPNTLRTPSASLAAILEPPIPVQPHLLTHPPPTFSLTTGPGAQQYVPPKGERRRRRRRGSSDSTITASSVEGEGGDAIVARPDFRIRSSELGTFQSETTSSEDEIPESQASQAATSMLRATPVEKGGSARSSFNSINSGTQSLGRSGGAMMQSALISKVSKSGSGSGGKGVAASEGPEKRRLTSYGDPSMMGSPVKKTRVEGIGLGIMATPAQAKARERAKARRKTMASGRMAEEVRERHEEQGKRSAMTKD